MPKLSIEEIEHPAYLVNLDFDVVWSNAAARSGALAGFPQTSPGAASSGVIKYLLQGRSAGDAESRDRLLQFHVGLAKERGVGLFSLCRDIPREQAMTLQRLYAEADQPAFGLVSHAYLSPAGGSELRAVCLYAVQFREGTLFVYVPGTAQTHRDLVIEDLVRKRVPVLTQVAVLVTDLQHSARIWSELPPEEYFELINDIWAMVDPIFRRHHGNQGKHGGDGMVCYFFPQPGSSHTWNAVAAAHEMREAMRQVSKAWQVRKGWNTELFLNTALNEGQEWLGTFQSASRTEFTVLGDTINHATRMSEFARSGTIWATKNLIGKLTTGERQRLTYGVRRKNSNGQEVLVSAVFSDVETLADPAAGERLREIARLPITEIVDIAESDPRAERASGPAPSEHSGKEAAHALVQAKSQKQYQCHFRPHPSSAGRVGFDDRNRDPGHPRSHAGTDGRDGRQPLPADHAPDPLRGGHPGPLVSARRPDGGDGQALWRGSGARQARADHGNVRGSGPVGPAVAPKPAEHLSDEEEEIARITPTRWWPAACC